MKLKTAKLIVESFQDSNNRWKRALQGTLKSKGSEEVISVSSWEVLGKVFSSPRLQILAAILHVRPSSIAQLAKALKKDFKNVYSDVKFLADLGLIDLKRGGSRRMLVPTARFVEIGLPLAA